MVPNIRCSRVYLIEGETLALVDTGLLGGARKVEDYIRSIGRRPEDLELVLMTHSHPDHTIGAGAIVKRTGAKLVAHPGDTRTFTPNDVGVSYLGLMSGMLPHLPFLRGIPVGRWRTETFFHPKAASGPSTRPVTRLAAFATCWRTGACSFPATPYSVTARLSAGRHRFPAPTLRTTAALCRSWEGWTSMPCAAATECPLLVAPRIG